ncbi:putative pyridine nucleotide-disulfide oxidoreductase [Streptomyces ambofaciens ATCC 23877]|uniref:Putative pyridine nucleotide-disulfide oxidoreductase n=1 Tax=Streptomyces ambofaciens (strain ATCC 23877 / 3486 / DSM 40053 / JCM 4204 / NBRC 12836 / NRRL B-2516) TaxID=278992 RepID=A3KIG7_STRA7|nr:FAD/NAD(P)-binding protein [Streptomyces ambofaciens]AKZ53627.1 putative pyridine nucleotide-disulfide oxidoreductase [Streptomyces ambofaciens ATCC 23877]CAJ89499.1 putative pyridine nucleotide-disulphide oxidoreductase [Streptomyces ambofaciens ATCC 23877]
MDIAIVGAGAATVGLLDTLAATADSPGAITVFEPSPHLWRGRPYGPELDTVLVNAPPTIMSIRHLDFGHYASWLGTPSSAHLDERLGQPLVPRALYGEYLAHTAETALASLREAGWRVRIVTARVVGVARPGATWSLRTEDGGGHEADHVALCVGGGTPQDHYGLGGASGFVDDPYPLARTLDRVAAGNNVAVIGSGLTAVDVAVSLAARGHTGPITLLSRSGVLPHVWQRPVEHRPQHVTAERVAALHRQQGAVTLEDLIGLLRAELATTGEDFEGFAADLLATTTEDPVRRLRAQLDAVDDSRIGRRVLQEAAHSIGPYAWRLLPEPDRVRLQRHFRMATSVASPMVPVNAATMMRLLDSGQLALAGGVHKIKMVQGVFRVHRDNGEHIFDAVINAVNPPPRAIPRGARQLVTALLADGSAELHPAGGLVPADPRLHVVGDLAGGGPFITSSIAGIAAQAAWAVHTIVAAGE